MSTLGLDLPTIASLSDAPVNLAAGACAAYDASNSPRYSYWLLGASDFWRFDHYANAWQNLPAPSNGTYGVANALAYDAKNGRVWAYLSDGATSAGLSYFDVSLSTWTTAPNTAGITMHTTAAALCVPTNSGGQWSGAPSIGSNKVYLVGGADQLVSIYNIDTEALSTSALGRGANVGAGCGLLWALAVSTDRLFSPRGGGSDIIDIYTMSTDAWSQLLIEPIEGAEDLPNSGSAWAHTPFAPTSAFLRTASKRVLQVNLATGSASPAATFSFSDTGTPQHSAFVAGGVVESASQAQPLLFAQAIGAKVFQRAALVQ